MTPRITRVLTVNRGALFGALTCIAAGAVTTVALTMCGSLPLPRCQVESLPAIAAYTPVGPPSGQGCANWVPPSLQAGGCGASGCVAALQGTVIGEAFGLESYFPNPNDTNANVEPGSMAIQNTYVGQRVLDTQNWIDAG